MLEIRWHGRGGQGAKTAALMLAEVCFSAGLFATGFPEYGPERMGAPITAYNKISDTIIRNHSNIYNPDAVVCVDSTLAAQVDMTEGLAKNGSLLVNASETEQENIKQAFADFEGNIFIIDGKKIATETIKKNIPNTVLLAAIINITKAVEEKIFFDSMREIFQKKFSKKTEVIEGNNEAIKRGYKEIIKIK